MDNITIADIKKSYLSAPDTDFYSLSLARYFFRPISFPLSYCFIKLKISPNQVTFTSWLFVLVGCFFYTKTTPTMYLMAYSCIFIWAILDYVDGSMARVLEKRSPFGHYIDVVGAYFVIALLPLCISIGLLNNNFYTISEQKLFIIVGAFSSVMSVLLRLTLAKGETIFNYNPRDAMGSKASYLSNALKWIEALMSPRGVYFLLLFVATFGPLYAMPFFIIFFGVYNISTSIVFFAMYLCKNYKLIRS